MTNIKLLLVEDNDTDALLVVRKLRKEGFDVIHRQVKTRNEMEQALSEENWDIVISDYSLPGFGGQDALELFKSKNLDIPFILVSGTVGEDIAVSIMKGGANDYLMKTHLNRLGPAVKRELEETQLKRDKKRIESVLDQTEKRFQRLIEDLRDVVFLSSIDGKKVYIINPAFNAIYGRSLAELEQNPLIWHEAIHDDDKALMETMTEELITTGQYAVEYRIVRPDSSVHWVYDRRCLVFTDGEAEPLMGGVVMDVTKKKQAEEDLIRAKKTDEESSRLKSALLQNMSHEFRTPMNGILGFSEFLFEELADEESRTKAEYILSSGKRLQQTLESIMFYAQLESGINLKPLTINVAETIRSVSEKIRKQAEDKELTLIVQTEDPLIFESDAMLIERILRELLDNAVKFTCLGGITVTAGYTDESHRIIQVRVKDTGIGIPQEKHALIFEEFRQAEEGYNRPYEGSGLGLSIVSKSIKILNGEFSLESNWGNGSTFTVSFPIAWHQEGGEIAQKMSETLSPPLTLPTGKRTPSILLVEDNDANVELVRLFTRGHFNLDVAKDGESAITLVKQNQYDGILMDIHLGHGMDGIDVITLIRKIPSYVTTPIIAVTGYTFRNEKEFITSKGANHYLEKPFTKQQLLETLAKGLM